VPQYLWWSEVPITFSREDHSEAITRPKWYPMVLNHMIRNLGLDKMVLDGGSGLDILFASTLNELGLFPLDLNPTDKPFFGIVPGDTSVPLGEIFLLVTFGTIKNYHTEYVCFVVADYKTTYYSILGRP
jgi:hypothetical protein